MKSSSSGPILDIFSPLKRKEVDSDTHPTERKEKRIKESTSSNLAKSTNTKRISTATIDTTTKPKSPDLHRNEIRSKERQMDKDALNALTSKSKLNKSQSSGGAVREGHHVKKPDPTTEQKSAATKSALQVSTKHNLQEELKTHSPRKSILKNTSPLTGVDARSTETVKSPRKSILKDISGTRAQVKSHSPRTRKSFQDGEISSFEDDFPDLEMASPVPTFRRKVPENPTIQRPSKPTTESPNFWTTLHEPSRPAPVPTVTTATTTSIPPSTASSQRETVPTEPLPADVGSAVVEIQTVLRRDIERLRLDMLRQFVSFRSEMGQKWEGEVGRLRQENEVLRGEVESLKKEAGRRNERSGWKLG